MDKNYLILLSGYHGAGKDTCADQLVEQWGATRFAFGDAIKEVVNSIFPWVWWDAMADHKLKDIPVNSPLNTKQLTPRQIVKEVDKLRVSVQPNMFTDRTLYQVRRRAFLTTRNPLVPIVIADVRFQHEIDAIFAMVESLKHSGVKLQPIRVLITRDGVGPTPEPYNQWIADEFSPNFVFENNGDPSEFPVWLKKRLESIRTDK